MNFVLVGAPLSGKGTISKLLCKTLQIPHISMGDLLREVGASKNKFSVYIDKMLKEGNFVNDELVKAILEDRLSKDDCKNGFILDGYPRNIVQAEYLDQIVKIDKVIYVTVSEITTLKRMETRYLCPKCQKIYTLENFDNNKCEDCNILLEKRKDDNKETLLKRIKDFEDITIRVLEKYYNENRLVTIENEGHIDDVFAELLRKLNI